MCCETLVQSPLGSRRASHMENNLSFSDNVHALQSWRIQAQSFCRKRLPWLATEPGEKSVDLVRF